MEDFKNEMRKGIKESLMSEEAIKRTQKYIDKYVSSWRSKEKRGLFDKWVKCDEYWEGDEVNKPEDDIDPGRNTNLVNSNIEGQVDNLVEQEVECEVSETPGTPKGMIDKAKLLVDLIEESNNMEMKLDRIERRRTKYGSCPIMVTFNPDSKTMKPHGMVEVKALHPAYTFFDPNIVEFEELQEGQFCGYATMKSIYWAKESFGDIADAIEPNYDPIETEYLFGEDVAAQDEISDQNYLHIFLYIKEKKDGENKLRLVQLSGCGTELFDSFKWEKENNEDYFPDDEFPIYLAPCYLRDGTVWPKGDAELLIPVNDLANEIDDQMMYSARLTGNPQKLVNKNSGIELNDWTNEAGLNIPFDATGEAPYYMINPPTFPSYIIDRRKYALEYESQRVTRFSDQSLGLRQTGVDTATEALQLQQNASNGTNRKKMLLQKTLSQVFTYALKLGMHKWNNTMQLNDESGNVVEINPSKLKYVPDIVPVTDTYLDTWRAEREAEQKMNPNIVMQEMPTMMQAMNTKTGKPLMKEITYPVKITVGAGMPTNKAFRYTVIKEAGADGLLSRKTRMKLMKAYVGLPIDIDEELKNLQAELQPQGQPQVPDNVNLGDSTGMNSNNNPAALKMLGGQ